MTGKPTVNGSGNGARSGAQTLVLLAMPLNALLLPALADGAKQQSELLEASGSPAQTTLRTQLRRLAAIGAVEKRRHNGFPGMLEYELTAAGNDLLLVLETLRGWLERAPGEPLQLGSGAARSAVKALAEGWSTTMLRTLAVGPHSLTELDRVIGALSYPSLERRLAAMRRAGQVEAVSGSSRGTPYAVTDWARRGVAPLAVAARWERRHLPAQSPPIGRIDVEAAFLLTSPLLRLEDSVSGSCRMAVEIGKGRGRQLAGVLVEIEEGKVASCTTRLQGTPDAWALGSINGWLAAAVEGDTDRIEPGGDSRLVRMLLDALHRTHFDVIRAA